MSAWWRELNAIRTHSERPRDISFRQFLAEKAQSENAAPDTLTPGHVIAALGYDPLSVPFKTLMADDDGFFVCAEVVRQAIDRGIRGLTLRQEVERDTLLKAIFSQAPIQTDPASRFITPELFMPYIGRGIVQGQYWDALISNDVTVSQPKVTMPLFSLSDAGLEERSEGATTKEGTVTYGSKTVTIKNRGKAVYFTDESVMFNSINLVSIFFEDLGRMLASGLNGEAVRVLRDGDQSDGSEAASVIGVTTANSFVYKDVVRVMVRMGMCGRPVSQVLAGEVAAVDWEDLAEVKNNLNAGGKLMPTMARFLKRPAEWDLIPAFNVPASKYLFNNPMMAMVALTAKPLTLEQERIIARRLNGTHADIWKGFAIEQATARVIVDTTITYAANPFPAAFNANQETW